MSEKQDQLAPVNVPLRQLLADMCRVLTFRMSAEGLAQLTSSHLKLGLFFTWLVGMGRYWDDPRAQWAQHLGLGSLAYVFVLSALLWGVFKLITPTTVRYENLLTFVSLTSAPALVYAIPVERFMSMQDATTANIWFLAIVASWRVALLFFYMVRGLKFRWLEILPVGLLPLTMIVALLAALNLEHVVFRIMGGLRDDERSANDAAYFILVGITYFSVHAAPFLLILYTGIGLFRRRERAKQREVEVDHAAS